MRFAPTECAGGDTLALFGDTCFFVFCGWSPTNQKQPTMGTKPATLPCILMYSYCMTLYMFSRSVGTSKDACIDVPTYKTIPVQSHVSGSVGKGTPQSPIQLDFVG